MPCRFSIYATICVATNFVVLTTFFLAAFVLNERRMAAHRLDCCCCVVAAAVKARPGDEASMDGSSESAGVQLLTSSNTYGVFAEEIGCVTRCKGTAAVSCCRLSSCLLSF